MRIEEVVGLQVRQRRESRGLTQEQLGKYVGRFLGTPWSRQAVSAAEKGKRNFAAAELIALALVLHTTVGNLLRPPVQTNVVHLGGSTVVTRDMLFDVIAGREPGDSVDIAAIQETLGHLAGNMLKTGHDFDRMMMLIRQLDAQIMERLADTGSGSHARVSTSTGEVSHYDPERGEWVKRGEQP